jgi:hypothetical protein
VFHYEARLLAFLIVERAKNCDLYIAVCCRQELDAPELVWGGVMPEALTMHWHIVAATFSYDYKHTRYFYELAGCGLLRHGFALFTTVVTFCSAREM